MSDGHNQPVTPAELKRIRAKLSMTQAALAAELGVRQETVARWEIGTRGIPEPTARLIERIAAEVEPRGITKRKR
jgi:DNA-binding transcriptional regulator YiaG